MLLAKRIRRTWGIFINWTRPWQTNMNFLWRWCIKTVVLFLFWRKRPRIGNCQEGLSMSPHGRGNGCFLALSWWESFQSRRQVFTINDLGRRNWMPGWKMLWMKHWFWVKSEYFHSHLLWVRCRAYCQNHSRTRGRNSCRHRSSI